MQPQSQMSIPQQAPPQQQSAFSPEEIQQMASDTGLSPQQVQQQIAETGATTKEELFPQVYGGQEGGGIAPGVAQTAMMDPSQQAPPPAAGSTPPPMASTGPRMRAQAAMRGETVPDESESPGEAQMESMMPGGGEASEGIAPNVAMAAHSAARPPMHRAMRGKPVHHGRGKHQGPRRI